MRKTRSKAILCLLLVIVLLTPLSLIRGNPENLKIEGAIHTNVLNNELNKTSKGINDEESYIPHQISDGLFNSGKRIKLPRPRYDSDTSIEEALLRRGSIREYSGESLTIKEISQLLWAAQGITSLVGYRTTPSAGALYPLEVYLVVGDVEGLAKGVYKYKPHWHGLVKTLDRDIREELAEAALEQEWVKEGAIDIVITAVYERTTQKYGERGIRYVHMEAGCAAQNVYLQAVSLHLGTVSVGAFYDSRVKTLMNIEEDPLFIMPVGRKDKGIWIRV